jgi:arginase
MRKAILIEAPSNLGLREPETGVEPGVKYFPEAMRKASFAELTGIQNVISVTPPTYSGEIDNEIKTRNAHKIIEYSKQLANVIQKNIQQGNFQIVVGGDCSILIGACLALKGNGNYGLFFLDGHTDYVLPHQSGSKGVAGMDLAIVTGNGHNKLTNIEHLKPYIEEENVFCCGNRDTSIEWYVNAITQSNIPYYDLHVLRKKEINNITNEFLQTVTSKKLDGFTSTLMF